MLTSKIAILGSSSFAGSVLMAELLKQGYSVLGLNRSWDLNHHLDKIRETLSDFQPAWIVDFAGLGMVAESWQHPEQWYQTNIVSKVKLHHWLKDQKWLEKYIRISTPEVYGSCDTLVTEDRHYAPSTPYAVSHAAIDMSLMAFYRHYGFPVIIGRFANFYGEHQQLYRIIPKTILSILSHQKLPLHGGGRSVRAFIHAKDVAKAILSMIQRGKLGEVYHFSPEFFFSIREVVQKICIQLNTNFEDAIETSPERPGNDQAYLMNADKAKRELEWNPQISFEDGLTSTIHWVSRDFETLSRMSWNYVHQP